MSTPNFSGSSSTATADRLNALLMNLTGKTNNNTAASSSSASNNEPRGTLAGRRGGGFDQSALSGDKFDRMFGAVVHPSVIAEQKKREREANTLAGIPNVDETKKKGGSKAPLPAAPAGGPKAGVTAEDAEAALASRVDWRALNRVKKAELTTPSGGASSTTTAGVSSSSTAELTELSAADALKKKLFAQQKERTEAIDHVKAGVTAASRAREEAEQRAQLLKYPPPGVETPEEIKQIIHPALHRAVFDKLKLESLTKVQQLSWGPMSDAKGGDVIIRSETGSGKTLAYALPLVNSLVKFSNGNSPFPPPEGTRITQKITREHGSYALILCPTRELADQVCNVVQILVTFNPNIVVGAIHGGENRHKEKARIRKGITILVATPGRMLDHLRTTEILIGGASTQGESRVGRLQTLVLDEADRLLDMGFENTMREICDMVKFSQKRVLVSATVTSDVQRLAHFALKQPILKVGSILGDDNFEVPRGLRQHYTIVPPKQRLAALLGFLRSQIDSGSRKIVVFVSTSDSAEFHYLLLSRLKNPYRNVGALLGRKGAAKFRNQEKFGAMGKRGRDDDNGSSGARKGHKKLLAKANAHIGFGDEDAFEEMDEADSFGGNQRGFVGINGESYSHNAEKSGFQMDEGDDQDGFLNVNVFKLHGNMTQVDRASVFHSFKHVGEKPTEKKKKNTSTHDDDDDVSIDSDDEVADAAAAAKVKGPSQQAILFCTDVAARGLDMPHIDWIVHYDPPADERCYVHRVGRTARIGRGGDSILFFHEHEEGFAKFLLSSLLKYKENQHTEHADVVGYGTDKVVTAAEAVAAEGSSPATIPNTNMSIHHKKSESYLFYLTKLDPASNHHWVQAAANLQRAISICVKNDTALNRTAMFAYLSYLRAYNGFPKAVKQYFDARLLHLGHIAASFGITSKPSEIRAELQANHAVDDELKLSRDTTQFRDHKRMEDIHKAPDTSSIGFGDDDNEGGGGRGSGGRGRGGGRGGRDSVIAAGYHSTLVSKQLQKTRDYHEIQKEKRKAIPKPFQFSEFDA